MNKVSKNILIQTLFLVFPFTLILVTDKKGPYIGLAGVIYAVAVWLFCESIFAAVKLNQSWKKKPGTIKGFFFVLFGIIAFILFCLVLIWGYQIFIENHLLSYIF